MPAEELKRDVGREVKTAVNSIYIENVLLSKIETRNVFGTAKKVVPYLYNPIMISMHD